MEPMEVFTLCVVAFCAFSVGGLLAVFYDRHRQAEQRRVREAEQDSKPEPDRLALAVLVGVARYEYRTGLKVDSINLVRGKTSEGRECIQVRVDNRDA